MKEQEHIPNILNSYKTSGVYAASAPYAVPDGYFDTLEAILLQKIKNIEENEGPEAYSLLKNISKKMPYHVPAGYFEEKETPLLRKRTFPVKKWYTVAAAAAIACVITLGAIQFFNRNEKLISAKANSELIIQYISNDELTNFADADYDNAMNIEEGQKVAEKNQLFKDISNQELQNFLIETSISDGILN